MAATEIGRGLWRLHTSDPNSPVVLGYFPAQHRLPSRFARFVARNGIVWLVAGITTFAVCQFRFEEVHQHRKIEGCPPGVKRARLIFSP
jgi:hypothetical protein